MPTTTAISKRHQRPAENVESLPQPVALVIDEDVDERLAHHQPDWQQNAEHRHAEGRAWCGWRSALQCPCRLAPASALPATAPPPLRAKSSASKRSGTSRHDPASGELAEQWSRHDDGRNRDGDAQRQGDAEVRAEQIDRGERSGVRRHQAVHGGKACERGDSDRDQRQLRALGDQVDDRHQQHQADLEEHRQADDRADQRHRPRQRPR